MKRIQAVLIDRDGTIGGSTRVELPGEFKLYERAEEAIRQLKDRNIQLYTFTNQPDISRGKCTKELFEEELRSFGFDKVYICPHTHEDRCSCRKPSTKMLVKAAEENNLDLSECVVIGDRWSDMLAAGKAGTLMILVMTGAGKEALTKYRVKWAEYEPDYVADDILDGIQWLIDKGLIVG